MITTVRSSIEGELKKNGKLIYASKGASMLPFIKQGRDLLVIVRPKGRLKKYDVPLYRRRGTPDFILHRVISVKDSGYITCGDNNRHKEYITDDAVVGVLRAVIRNNKEIPLTGLKYQCYVHLWCDLFYIRAGVILVRDLLRRITRRKTYIKIDRH